MSGGYATTYLVCIPKQKMYFAYCMMIAVVKLHIIMFRNIKVDNNGDEKRHAPS